MAARMSYDLSDALKEMARRFRDFDHSGVQLEGRAVITMIAQLKTLSVMALDLEHEVSRHRWNDAARRERAVDAQRIAAEACRPGSNVALFPVIPRPFCDGVILDQVEEPA